MTVNKNGHLGMNYDALLRLLGVAEAGSFAAAARQLGVSRQAIHRSVDALEQDFGATLFDRGARRLRLTDLGRRLLPHARAVRAAGLEATALVASATQAPSGTVRLTAPPLFAQVVLARVLPTFLLSWPQVRVAAHFDTTRSELHRDDYDLMIRIGAAPSGDTYAALLGRAGLCLCAAPSYLQQRGAPEHPEQLAEHDLLTYANEPMPSWWLERGHESVTLAVDARMTSNDAPVVMEACAAGLGIVRIPAMAATAALSDGRVVQVLQQWSLPTADVWAVYGHRSPSDPTLQALLDALRSASW